MNGKMGLLVGVIFAAGSAGAAHASIVTPENLSDVTVTAGYIDSWYVTGSDLPNNQNPATIASWLTSTLGLPTATTVSQCDNSGACGVSNNATTFTSSPADIFAVHFGQNELVFEYASLITSFHVDLGNEQGLSNIRSFSVPTATPLPAALPLFAGGLGAMGLFGWRKRRKNAIALSAA
jgi:hypothetical protein